MSGLEGGLLRGIESRRTITFSQAEGLEMLPDQLKPRTLSKELRARIWLVIYASMKSSALYQPSPYGSRPVVGADWSHMLAERWVVVQFRMIDEFDESFTYWTEELKKIISSAPYNVVFDLLQFFLRNSQAPAGLARGIEQALVEGRSAYRLVDGDVIVPLALEGEIGAVAKAFSDVSGTEYNGARSHLRASAQALVDGDFAGSIRESIHAVDGVARSLAPQANDLSPALSALEKAGYIHSAMKGGFSKLYGYSSNEKGVRHALIEEGAAKVTEVDAIYMLGSCAAFVSYLIGKAKEFGLRTAG